VRLPHPRLLVITDRRQARAPLDQILAAAFDAGCRWASVREKDLPSGEQVALARRLLPLARRHGATLTLHAEAPIAAEAGVDGVHLSAGADAQAARALMGQAALIGISVHAADEAAALTADSVDYAIAGPAYDTASKLGYGPVLGPGGIRTICRASALPVLAIGGITAGGAAEMIRAGAAGVAVMGSLMQAGDPRAVARRLLEAISVR
jgi:thiamine-phosphate pyrophosphorylase